MYGYLVVDEHKSIITAKPPLKQGQGEGKGRKCCQRALVQEWSLLKILGLFHTRCETQAGSPHSSTHPEGREASLK